MSQICKYQNMSQICKYVSNMQICLKYANIKICLEYANMSHPLSLSLIPSLLLLLLLLTPSTRGAARTGTLESPEHRWQNAISDGCCAVVLYFGMEWGEVRKVTLTQEMCEGYFPHHFVLYLQYIFEIMFFLLTLFKCTFCLTACLLSVQPESDHPDTFFFILIQTWSLVRYHPDTYIKQNIIDHPDTYRIRYVLILEWYSSYWLPFSSEAITIATHA